ncbi:phosphatase PAP2 family protein [Pectobacterium cacticida]|uniref:phosphatase PAP2 family protein n=1 Tax=Pectobacterium cacticida TaxID=69221 RepID=UPI002FEF735E
MNWNTITFLGDSTLLLPCALFVFLALWFMRDRVAAWQWVCLFGLTGVVVCVSKLAFMGWGVGIRSLNFTGFSGHTALSSCFWPILFWLLGGRFSPPVRRLFVTLGFILAVVIGYSRLMVHAHSASEVMAGMVLGLSASSVLLFLQRNKGELRILWPNWVALVAMPLLLLNLGEKAPTQSLLGHVAVTIAQVEKPYTRADLLSGAIP